MIRDCPQAKNHAKAYTQPQSNPIAAAEPPKKNRFYALKGREEHEKSADVVTSNLHVYSFLMYAFLDQVSIHLVFVTPQAASKFNLLSEVLHELFLVCNPIEDNTRDEIIY